MNGGSARVARRARAIALLPERAPPVTRTNIASWYNDVGEIESLVDAARDPARAAPAPGRGGRSARLRRRVDRSRSRAPRSLIGRRAHSVRHAALPGAAGRGGGGRARP